MVIIALVYVILHYVGQRTEVIGSSMNDTLSNEDNLWIDKLSYRFTDPKRFDIIVFREEETNKPLIKRVIGLPGETIRYKNDILYVDGKKIEEPFLADLKTTLAKNTVLTDDIFETRIPYDAYFVLGDNRKISRDSRLFGVVIQEEVIGEVKFRFWPPNKINRFP